MTRLEQSIEVNVPTQTVYNQLTQFEEYPRFMDDVQEVKQVDDTHLHWRARLNSHDTEWDAEIIEQVPDQLIVWRNEGSPIQLERMQVQPLDGNKTRLTLTLEYDEAQGDEQGGRQSLGARMAEHAVHDLVRFKRFIEGRDAEGSEGKQQPASTQPSSSLSKADLGGRRTVAEEHGFDQQGDQARRVGHMPEGNLGPHGDVLRGAIEAMTGTPGQQRGEQHTQQRQALQGSQGGREEAGTIAAMPVNPQTWLPNLLHAWEEPFVMMRKMTEDMDQLFERFLGRPMVGSRPRQPESPAPAGWVPPVDITQRQNQLIVCAEVPGVEQNDLQIEIRSDRLIIEGDRRDETSQQAGGYRRSERSFGHFYRVIALPEGVNPDEAVATMRNGVLEITIPIRQARQQGRRLEIR